MTADVTTTAVRTNPYVGPQSFRRGDQLYGRDREAADLVDLLVAERIVLLHSPSGAGKTSLIQARLVPMLEEDGFEVLPVVRVSREPTDVPGAPAGVNRYVLSTMLSLEEGLPTSIQHTVTELAGMSLAQYMAQRPDMDGSPGNEVLIFDQFEEVITADPVDQEDKAAFFVDLGAMLSDRKLWALFAAREDFLAEFAPYVRPVPTRLSTRYRLDLLTADQALDAMTLPAQAAGVDFDIDAAGRLVDDLRKVRVQHGSTVTEEKGPHVEPVQLQVVCRLMWDRLASGARRIEIADVEAVGDVDRALAEYYARSVAGVCADTGLQERSLRDWIELALITNQEFRAQVMRGPPGPDDISQRVLSYLTDRHLLRAESRRGAVWYELAHDRLVEPIQHDNEQWRSRNLTTLEHRARNWEAESRPDRLLLTGPELTGAHQWADSAALPLTDVELAFLHASDAAQQQVERLTRANSRTRRWLAATITVCVLALVAAGLAMRQSARAGEARESAAQAALVGQALARLDVDNQLGLLLGERATTMTAPVTEGQSWQAQNLLQRALDQTPVIRTFHGVHGPALAVANSDDGERVGTVAEDGTIELWNAHDGHLVASRPGIGKAEALAFDHGGDRIAVAGEDGRVAMWTPLTTSFVVVDAHYGAAHAVSFSPDDTMLASAGEAGRVTVLDAATGAKRLSLERTFALHGVGWAANGTKLVAVDADGSLATWDIRHSGGSGGQGISYTAEKDRKGADYDTAVTMDVSRDGSQIATGGYGQVTIWDVAGKREPVRKSWTADVLDVSFTSDARRLFALDADGNVWIVDTTTEDEPFISFWESGTLPRGIDADPTRTDRAIVQTGKGDAALWNLPETHSARLTTLDISRDGTVATGSRDGSVRLWSVDSAQVTAVARHEVTGVTSSPEHGRLIEPVHSSDFAISKAAMDPQGRYVVSVDGVGNAAVTSLVQGQSLPQLDVRGTSLNADGFAAAAVSPTGRLIATGDSSGDDDLRLWDATTGKELYTLSGHGDAIAGLRFGATDDEFVSISNDGTALVWDLAHRTSLHTLDVADRAADPAAGLGGASGRRSSSAADEGHKLTAVDWGSAPSGQNRHIAIAVGSDVQLWNPGTGQLERTLHGHLDRVASVAFDATGQRLISAGDDNTAVIWDSTDGHVIRRITHNGWISGAAFLPGGDRVILVGGSSASPRVAWLDDAALLRDAQQRTTRPLSAEECEQFQQLAGEDWHCVAPTAPTSGATP